MNFQITPVVFKGNPRHRLEIAAGPGWKRLRKIFKSEAAAKEFKDDFFKRIFTHGASGATVSQNESVVMARWLRSFSLAELDAIFMRPLATTVMINALCPIFFTCQRFRRSLINAAVRASGV